MSSWVSNELNAPIKTLSKQIDAIETFIASVADEFNIKLVSLDVASITTDKWNEKVLFWTGTANFDNTKTKVKVYGFLENVNSKKAIVSVHDFKSGKVYCHPLALSEKFYAKDYN